MFRVAAPALATAQVPAIALKPANATLAAEFTGIASVRELADGRLLITDWRENRLVVADLRTGSTTAVSRKGSGPGEFQYVGSLLALGGDSTLVPDRQFPRWLLLRGDVVVATIPAESPALKAAGNMLMGADYSGRVLAARPWLGVNGKAFRAADSLLLVRVHRATGRADTLGRLRSPYERGQATHLPNGASEVSVPPLAVGDQALLFPDGWIAIARLEPYLVEWHSADGRVVRGSALPFPPVKVNDREKSAYRARYAKSFANPPPLPDAGWPATLPSFDTGALLASPDGRLVIAHMPSADAAYARYDVVDRRGTLAGQVSLTDGARIVGFGVRSVYVSMTNDDGIERLQRHPWP